MTEAKLRALIDLVDELANGPEPWKKKREALLAQCSEDQKIALEEFAGWFEEA